MLKLSVLSRGIEEKINGPLLLLLLLLLPAAFHTNAQKVGTAGSGSRLHYVKVSESEESCNGHGPDLGDLMINMDTIMQ